MDPPSPAVLTIARYEEIQYYSQRALHTQVGDKARLNLEVEECTRFYRYVQEASTMSATTTRGANTN